MRVALAGGFEECVDTINTVQTKPGGTVGPVGQGLNTRLNDYGGGGVSADEYPPDMFIREPVKTATIDNNGDVKYQDTSGAGGAPWGYSDYEAELPDCTGVSGCMIENGGRYNRRILPVPIVDCSTATGGTNTFNVEAIGCFFLLQKAPTNNSGKQAVFGEFIEDCTVANGTFGNTPPPGDPEGPFRIVLYKDPLGDSS